MSELNTRPHHPPRPCEKCGSTNISVSHHDDVLEFKCNDCGHTWSKTLPPRPPRPPKESEE
jgi:hypothetical protein